jgi:hypothetical protein
MTLSPSDRAAVLELAADKIAAEIRREFDLAELMTVPVSMVSQLTGLSRSQVERSFTLRPMGKRRNGVSMKALQAFIAAN